MTALERRVLVVDDEEPIRNAFAKALRRSGYDVRAAASGEEALALMRNEPAWVVFLDLNMPGMDGVELCQRIHAQWPMAVPFAVTGYASLFELSGCRAAGFEDYFTKPISLENLLGAAGRAFDKLERWKSTSAARGP